MPDQQQIRLQADLRAGAAVARSGQGLAHLLGTETESVGYWSDGLKMVGVETVTWLSERLLSRWLGYLDELENLGPAELERRMDMIRDGRSGREWFLISLRSYPKQVPFEVGDQAPARSRNLTLSSCTALIGKHRHPLDFKVLSQWTCRDRQELHGYRWWLDLPFGGPITPQAQRTPAEHSFDLGEYSAVWILASFRTDQLARPFVIELRSPGKTRLAHFDLPRKRGQKW